MAKKKPDKKHIANLAINHELSSRQIAALTGGGKTRIAEIIQEVKNDVEYQAFTANKDKVFENLQYKLINLADDDALKTMLSKRGMTDVAILEDKIRLLRGESTANISYDARTISASVSELRAMIGDKDE